MPLTVVLRSYRLGATRFQHWCFQELTRRTADAAVVGAAALFITEVTADYVDLVSEQLVSAYEYEQEHWLRNLSATREARRSPSDTPWTHMPVVIWPRGDNPVLEIGCVQIRLSRLTDGLRASVAECLRRGTRGRT